MTYSDLDAKMLLQLISTTPKIKRGLYRQGQVRYVFAFVCLSVSTITKVVDEFC